MSAENGMDVFRVFDAVNDPRNMAKAMQTVAKTGKHAQGTICYTISPVHTVEGYVKLAGQLLDMGAQSICLKDMAALLKPPCPVRTGACGEIHACATAQLQIVLHWDYSRVRYARERGFNKCLGL